MRTAITMAHAAPGADDRPVLPWSEPATSVGLVEPGHGSASISMTYAAVPARYRAGSVYEPPLTSRSTTRSQPAITKAGITAGMSMTEKQGGSDARAAPPRRAPNADGAATDRPQVVHFAPRCIFLVLAQAPDGLCFAAAGKRPTAPATECSCSGSRTSSATKRASSEVEYDGAVARLVARAAACRPSSRWSTSPGWISRGSATSMRTGLTCVHHAQHRKAFGFT